MDLLKRLAAAWHDLLHAADGLTYWPPHAAVADVRRQSRRSR
jgi:hypothetical protein